MSEGVLRTGALFSQGPLQVVDQGRWKDNPVVMVSQQFEGVLRKEHQMLEDGRDQKELERKNLQDWIKNIPSTGLAAMWD